MTDMEVVVSDKVIRASETFMVKEISAFEIFCRIIILKLSNSPFQDETLDLKPIKDAAQTLEELETEDLYTKYKVFG